MARHVLDAGHELRVWNRSPGKADDLVASGAVAAATPAAAASGAQAVVLMLSDPDAVRDVLFGSGGVVTGADRGTLVIDSSTIGPSAARTVAAALDARGLSYVDAPVFGTVGPARDGTLRVVVGGSEVDYAAAEPLLHCWGAPDAVRRIGEVGTASALKIVGNSALGVVASGLGEALRLATTLGAPREAVLATLRRGPYGWTLEQKEPMLADGDYGAATFSLDLMAKDLRLAVEEGGAELPTIAAAAGNARAAAAAGHGADDYAAVIGWLAS